MARPAARQSVARYGWTRRDGANQTGQLRRGKSKVFVDIRIKSFASSANQSAHFLSSFVDRSRTGCPGSAHCAAISAAEIVFGLAHDQQGNRRAKLGAAKEWRDQAPGLCLSWLADES